MTYKKYNIGMDEVKCKMRGMKKTTIFIVFISSNHGYLVSHAKEVVSLIYYS